jgi:hypothetical protein
MRDMLDTQVLNLVMSSASLAISLALLFVHLKNRKTQLRSYVLARAAARSSSINLQYVSSEQLDGKVLIKLVLFNPGSIAIIIQALAVHKKVESRFFLLRLLGLTEWTELDQAAWWPTSDSSCKDEKFFADEYKSLYVEDYRDIFALLLGCLDRNMYRFHIQTNNGDYIIYSIIYYVGNACFPRSYWQWFRER